jgi:hypothetical protein
MWSLFCDVETERASCEPCPRVRVSASALGSCLEQSTGKLLTDNSQWAAAWHDKDRIRAAEMASWSL